MKRFYWGNIQIRETPWLCSYVLSPATALYIPPCLYCLNITHIAYILPIYCLYITYITYILPIWAWSPDIKRNASTVFLFLSPATALYTPPCLYCLYVAYMLPTYCLHIAYMLPIYCLHIADILPLYCLYCIYIAYALPIWAWPPDIKRNTSTVFLCFEPRHFSLHPSLPIFPCINNFRIAPI